jgi:hypothetical protein
MEDRRVAIENDGLVFLAVKIDDFFALGDGGQRLASQAKRFEGFGGGVQLAEAAIDEDERGKGLWLFRGLSLGG